MPYRHMKENFTSETLNLNRGQMKISGQMRKEEQQLLDDIAYARLDSDFNTMMENMRFQPGSIQLGGHPQ